MWTPHVWLDTKTQQGMRLNSTPVTQQDNRYTPTNRSSDYRPSNRHAPAMHNTSIHQTDVLPASTRHAELATALLLVLESFIALRCAALSPLLVASTCWSTVAVFI